MTHINLVEIETNTPGAATPSRSSTCLRPVTARRVPTFHRHLSPCVCGGPACTPCGCAVRAAAIRVAGAPAASRHMMLVPCLSTRHRRPAPSGGCPCEPWTAASRVWCRFPRPRAERSRETSAACPLALYSPCVAAAYLVAPMPILRAAIVQRRIMSLRTGQRQTALLHLSRPSVPGFPSARTDETSRVRVRRRFVGPRRPSAVQ